MNRGYDHKQFEILFVDDEPQALKYFQKACEKDFVVAVASSVAEAHAHLDEHGDSVGVIITDQRMPKETGVDLLTKVRDQRPGIVRILTTAYSDLDSAIEAVNSGAIYQYVTKPWDIRELRGVLMRAMELFLIQRDRDLLLREKLNAIHRVLLSDRVRSLAVMATCFRGYVRHSVEALLAFLHMAAEVRATHRTAPSGHDSGDLWDQARRESQELMQLLATLTTELRDAPPVDVSVESLLRDAVSTGDHALQSKRVTVQWALDPNATELVGHAPMLRRLIGILVTQAIDAAEVGATIRIEAAPLADVHGTHGIRLKIGCGAQVWPVDSQLLFAGAANPGATGSQAGHGLLAYLIAHHHGGWLKLQSPDSNGAGFTLALPIQAAEAKPPIANDAWLDQLYSTMADWDQMVQE